MRIHAGSHITHDLTILVDGLITHHIAAGDVYGECDQAFFRALFFFKDSGFPADEIPFVKVHKAAHPRGKRSVNGPIFRCPGAEAFLEAHRSHGA